MNTSFLTNMIQEKVSLIINDSVREISRRISELIYCKYCDSYDIKSYVTKVLARLVGSFVNDSDGVMEMYGNLFITDSTHIIEEESSNMVEKLKKALYISQLNTIQNDFSLAVFKDATANSSFLSIADLDKYIFRYLDTISNASEWTAIGIQMLTRHSFKIYNPGFIMKLGYNIITVNQYIEELNDYLYDIYNTIMWKLEYITNELKRKCFDIAKLIIKEYENKVEQQYVYFLMPYKYHTECNDIYMMCCILYYEIVNINKQYWFIKSNYDPYDRILIYYIAGRVKETVQLLSQSKEEEIAYFISEHLDQQRFK